MLRPGSDAPGLTAIVVGHDHAHTLERCLDSLEAQSGVGELELLYVDNASRDGSLEVARRRAHLCCLANEENLGFARAVNQALDRARGRFLALVNPDAELPADALRRLVAVLEARPCVGLVAPALVGEDGAPQVSRAPYPELASLAARWLGGRPRRGWLIGAVLVTTTRLLRELGGLDQRYFVYGEDMDLCWRLERAGRELWLEPSVIVRHLGNPRWTPDRLARVYGGYLRFAAEHLPRQRPLLGLLLSGLWLARGAALSAPAAELARGLRRLWSTAADAAPARGPARPVRGGPR